jgi:hypothetical protein
MDVLRQWIGIEQPLDEFNRGLRDIVTSFQAPVVGALEVCCSDESELECMAAFQTHFVEHLLPDLKRAARAPFRTCNLGARYEWGSIRVAEQHFALPESADAFKVMVVKINGHVCVQDTANGPHFGPMQRYDTDSCACGALHATIDGGNLPALAELRDTLMEGSDRLATLRDPRRVDPAHRYLFAAIVSARLQARRALQDIRTHTPQTPTLYLVLPCVTLNRPGPDSALLCGYYIADQRIGIGEDEAYIGLDDEPADYRLEVTGGRLRVSRA